MLPRAYDSSLSASSSEARAARPTWRQAAKRALKNLLIKPRCHLWRNAATWRRRPQRGGRPMSKPMTYLRQQPPDIIEKYTYIDRYYTTWLPCDGHDDRRHHLKASCAGAGVKATRNFIFWSSAAKKTSASDPNCSTPHQAARGIVARRCITAVTKSYANGSAPIKIEATHSA